MKQSPELEALAASGESDIGSQNIRRNQLAILLLFLAGCGALIYFIFMTSIGNFTDNESKNEEFNTTSFRPGSFVRETPKPAEPETPAPPPAQVPATPPPPPPQEFPARFKSKLVQMDQSRTAEANESGTGSDLKVAGDDRNSKYLAALSGIGGRSATAAKIKRIDAVIPEGTLIPGILETAIISDLPGQIRAVTSRDVYSFDGRRVLVPTGTRLIGEYQSSVANGQTRIFVVWTRLIRDDGVSVSLNSIGTDSLGRSGLTGIVDKKWRERFGSAILLSVVGAGASYLTGYGSGNAFGDDSSNAQSGEQLARRTIAQTFSDMANTALSENIKIPPTINVHQGERIFIFVRQDLDFSALYKDPVTEALEEIQREHRRQ